MSSKKELRQLAIEREYQRRNQETAEACPVSGAEFAAMVDHVSDHIVECGHKHNFEITSSYLREQGLPVDAVLSFLSERRIRNDWDVLVSGDADRIFGPSSDGMVRMPLGKEHLNGLLAWLNAEIQVSGCDHSLRLTKCWLLERGLPATRTIGALMALGGFCDCEVVMNVETDGMYPTTNNEHQTRR